MKIKKLIKALKKLDPEKEVVAAAFYGPGSPWAELYPLTEEGIRDFEAHVWLTFDVPDRASKDTLQREGRRG